MKQVTFFKYWIEGQYTLTPVGRGTVVGRLVEYNYDTKKYEPTPYIRVVMDEGIAIPSYRERLLPYHGHGDVVNDVKSKKVVDKILNGRKWCRRSVLCFREEALSVGARRPPFYGNAEIDFDMDKPVKQSKSFPVRSIGYSITGEHLAILDAHPSTYQDSDGIDLYIFKDEAWHYVSKNKTEFKSAYRVVDATKRICPSGWVDFDNHIFSGAEWKGVLKKIKEYTDSHDFLSEIKLFWVSNFLTYNCLRPAPRVNEWLE